jgi:hypothetical protein
MVRKKALLIRRKRRPRDVVAEPKVNPKTLVTEAKLRRALDELEAVKTPAQAAALAARWGGGVTQRYFIDHYDVGSDTCQKTHRKLWQTDIAPLIKSIRTNLLKKRLPKGSSEFVEADAPKPNNEVQATEKTSEKIERLERELKLLKAMLTAATADNLRLIQEKQK